VHETRFVRGLGGPGGLRCRCCGGGGGRHRVGAKQARRKTVRALRRKLDRLAVETFD